MLAISDQHTSIAEVNIAIKDEKLAQHIAKILAKISAKKIARADMSRECFEAKLS